MTSLRGEGAGEKEDRDGEGEEGMVGKFKGWKFMSGEEMHTWPMGWLSWIICVRES